MKPEPGSSLDGELHRLRRWLALFEAWGQCQRRSPDVHGLAQGLCRLLVDNADYARADINLVLPGGATLHCQAQAEHLVATLHPLSFPIQWGEVTHGTLQVHASFTPQARPENHDFLARMAGDLAHGIGALQAMQGHVLARSCIELLALAIEQSPFGIVVMDIAARVEYCNRNFTAMTGFDLADIVGSFAAGPPQGETVPSGLMAAAPGLPAQDGTARRGVDSGNAAACKASAVHEVTSVGGSFAAGPPQGETAPHPWNPAETSDAIYRSLLASQNLGEHWHGEVHSRRKDGSLYWERQVVSTLRDADGQHTHLIVVKEDISNQKGQRADFEQTRLLHEQALVSSSNGIMITRSDAGDHSIVYVNPAFERITGYRASEVIGLEGRFLVRDDLAQPDLENIRCALRERREGQATLRNYRKDGSLFWNELHIAPVRDLTGAATTHFVSVINDISERVRYQQALEYQSNHDSLTGLANRNLLNDRIEQAIAWAKRNGHVIGVMLLDLDHFKLINDASGHSAGDALLQEVARRLSACVRETDTVARLGGDEFVIILTDLPQPDDVDQIAVKVLSALSRPIEMVGRDVFVTASIGVSLYPRDGDHGETLLRYADMAMYRVKEHGRNSVRQFVPEMGSSAISRLDMESALRRGLERGEFLLHYQPKIDLASQRIVGAEALIRWQHPQIGLVHPIEFIRVAEDTGLILPLGEWVLTEACRQQVLWQQEGMASLKIAINMSARQFRQEDLAERISAVFASTGANPGQIILELTESMVMHDVDSTLVSLRALKRLGVSLSLDDFGTGYSSLSYLRRFPIDELKIDRSFINDIHVNADDAAIAGAIVAMARSLGLSVVAEGVEKKEQADLLSTLGCNQVQGYYYARPLTVSAFAARLHEQQDRPA